MKLSSSTFAAPVTLIVASLFLMNCSSDAPAPEGGAGAAPSGPEFAAVKGIINMSCFGNGCHSQEGNRLQMKLDDKLHTTLTTHVTLNCGKLVNTAVPADSAIVKLMLGDCGTAPNITPRMPEDKCFQGDVNSELCVSAANVELVKAWIAKGAPK